MLSDRNAQKPKSILAEKTQTLIVCVKLSDIDKLLLNISVQTNCDHDLTVNAPIKNKNKIYDNNYRWMNSKLNKWTKKKFEQIQEIMFGSKP